MTDTSHRLYAVAIAVVVFFVSWATVAAKPWATAKPDPRLAALAQREQRLRSDAKLVQQVVDNRMIAYRLALKARKAQIASVQARAAAARAQALQVSQSTQQATQSSAATSVRVVNLPPLTVTRTS
jgi:transcription initiation factor TFIIIB Brf1 subunit/transcription initiation factor TFIIB